ncbi:hypothetical protein ACP70R_008364 [Stipagrostis hirtigluma subsp. patula]
MPPAPARSFPISMLIGFPVDATRHGALLSFPVGALLGFPIEPPGTPSLPPPSRRPRSAHSSPPTTRPPPLEDLRHLIQYLPLMGPGGRLFFSTKGTPSTLFGSTSVQHQCIPQVTIGTDVTCQAKSGMVVRSRSMRSRNFLIIPRRKDSRSVKIKRNQFVVKFKVCCSKCTLSVFDAEKANKLK